MKITREALKTIVKETMIEESEYQDFFKRALEKAGGSIPKMSDDEKKAFFNNIEKTWKGKGEKNERFGRGNGTHPTFGSADETVKVEEAQSPAQKAAFEKMLAKNKKDDDTKEEVKESVQLNEDKVSNRTVSTLQKGIQRILGTEVNHDINDNGAHEFYVDYPEFTIGVGEDETKKTVYAFSIYDDGARKYLGKGKAADEKDLIKKVLSSAKKYKKQLLLTTESVSESVIKEGFGMWEMSFADMNLNGVKLSKKNKYKVKARNTVEAIKKAASMAGLKGQDWVATHTHSLKKIG